MTRTSLTAVAFGLAAVCATSLTAQNLGVHSVKTLPSSCR